ncbi:MAG TPA: SGNH/GDSL hydrolase family protein [Phenylobacterium sp.]
MPVARLLHTTWRALALAAAIWAGLAAAAHAERWVGSWASAQQTPEDNNALPAHELDDATLRQVVRLSLGGPRLRVRLSNAFGTQPLHVVSAHVARAPTAGSARIDPASDRPLTFAGQPDVVIPAGAEYLSDPVALPAPALSRIAVSLYFPAAPAQQTSHPGSRATSYLAHGNQVSAADLPQARKVEHWFQLSGIEVGGPAARASVAVLGDSITDGHGATTNGDDRWPDQFARRLQGAGPTRGLGVLNLGIGGNRVLLDGLGPNALARFDRDVLAQAGVRAVILLEGVNDLGTLTRDHPVDAAAHAGLVHQIVAAYAQMAARAHAHGLRAIGATILPYGGSDYYHPDAANEADRQAVNQWIRAPGHFDAVVDFDRAMSDPAHPERLRPAYDSGDHLHPSPAGYRAMAQAVPLSLVSERTP